MTTTVLEVTNCTECPFYMKAGEARDATGLPYFGMCKGTGRFINTHAAATLPTDPIRCPEHGHTVAAREDHVRDLVSPDPVSPFAMRVAPAMLADQAAEHIKDAGPVRDSSGEVIAPDSCKRCIFFQPKNLGQPGTPAARYDLCQRRGVLIGPGERATKAAACHVGLKGTPYSPDYQPRPLLPIYLDETPTEPSGEPVDGSWGTVLADIEARVARDSAAPKHRAEETVPPFPDLDPDMFGGVMPVAEPEIVEVAMAKAVASEPITMTPAALGDLGIKVATKGLKGPKSLPTRVSKTGIYCPATEYTMQNALPEGALGVVSVRSTSKARDFVWLPYFDPTTFPVEAQQDVPEVNEQAYFDHSDLLYHMAIAYLTDSVCALWGDAGVGKTEAVEEIARITRQPFTRISIKWATQVDDIIGRYTLRGGDMEWLDGRLTRVWRMPYIVCVDEPNTGKDEVWQALRAPFDGARALALDEKDGERIPRHPSCRIFTAMNPSWDPRFTGTRPISDADVDRMEHIAVPYPPTEIERQIIVAKAPAVVGSNEEQVKQVLNVARDIRAAVKAKTIRVSFGLRKVLRWTALMEYMTPLAAFDQAVTAWMEPNEARALRDLADAYFKE